MRKGAILVIEKDPLSAALIVGQLEELGYEIEGPAHTFEDAVWLATHTPIAGALLDIAFGDGAQATLVANALIKRTIPFVFLAGAEGAAEHRFREVPVLSKPVTLTRLEQAMLDILR